MSYTTRKSVVESLETRMFLSISAEVTDGVLNITSNGSGDFFTVQNVVLPEFSRVIAGTTSVALDQTTLQTQAGLTVTAINSTATPPNGSFQAAFKILPTSSLTYTVDPFAATGGVVRHSGTIVFNNTIVMGRFRLGFDASRATNGRSGFVLRDTVGGLGNVFDLATPSSNSIITDTRLRLAADLMITPEFSALLQSRNLATTDITGLVVGNALVNARSSVTTTPSIRVSAQGFDQRFALSSVRSININLPAGDNSMNLLNLSRSTTVVTGNADDQILVVGGRRALSIQTAAGTDSVQVIGGAFSSLTIDTGADDDRLTLTGVRANTASTFAGGDGNDELLSFQSVIPGATITGFERSLLL
jgi:hypothetical protein